MSTRKGRGAKVLTVPQDERQKGSPFDSMESPNLSAIDKASFLEGLQANYGNPLHSTAMEEDLNVSEVSQKNKGKAGKMDIPQTAKTTVKQSSRPAVKRKATERDGENEEEEERRKRSRKSTGGRGKAKPEKEEGTKKKGALQGKRGTLNVEKKESDQSSTPQKNNQRIPAATSVKRLIGKKPAKRRSAGQTTAVRQVKSQQMKKDRKRKSESERGTSSGPQSQEESDAGTPQQTRRGVLSSDEETVDEDKSWNPGPEKAKAYSLVRTRKSNRSKSRKSSSGSTSSEPQKSNTNKQKKSRRGGTELEVVLDAFLDFCEQYRESVESKAVKQTIDSFSSNVEDQLLEKITSNKEFKFLKRENAKVGSLIRKKTQRLLDAKHELIRAERQMSLLQKEKAELQLALADLGRSQALLQDIRELNKQYLDHRHKHPEEKETYGASSLPALLLETKHIQTTEQQLKRINNRLEKRLKMKRK